MKTLTILALSVLMLSGCTKPVLLSPVHRDLTFTVTLQNANYVIIDYTDENLKVQHVDIYIKDGTEWTYRGNFQVGSEIKCTTTMKYSGTSNIYLNDDNNTFGKYAGGDKSQTLDYVVN